MSLILFGLTGGIGSGKSTVADRFRLDGVAVVDADQLAREVVAPGSDGLREVIEAFGETVVTPDGSLNRAKLGEMVFGDRLLRQRLNAIVHPRIAARTLEAREKLEQAGETLACYEAALLIENGMADAFRPLVLVAASEAVQVLRTMRRDGLTEAQARARVSAQLPLADKAKVADYVVDNSGDLAATLAQADQVLAQIRRATALKTGVPC